MAFGCRAAAALRVDTGVVDDRIHAPHRVDLFCDAPGLGGATEVSDDNPCRTRRERSDARCTIHRSRMQHHLVAVTKKRLRRRPPQAVRAARDEDNRHPLSLCDFSRRPASAH